MANKIITNVKKEITKVINKFGKTLTIKSKGTITYDEWGEPTKSATTDVSTLGVVDNYIISQLTKNSPGFLKEGQSIIILKADETVDDGYTIVMDSKEYKIVNIQRLEVSNILIAYQLIIQSM